MAARLGTAPNQKATQIEVCFDETALGLNLFVEALNKSMDEAVKWANEQ